MKRITSEKYFHKKPENLNCAQSVLKGFQEEFQISDEVIESFRAYGGGRAENGLCGALYAANYLMQKKGNNFLDRPFSEKTTYVRCRDIKQNKCCSCEECVKIADQLIENSL